MAPSSTHGAQPLVSSRLTDYLQTETEESVSVRDDEFDRLIAAEGLQIGRFTFFRDMDMWLLVLTNRRIISRRLSDYPFLKNATDQQLMNYVLSETGIHWPAIDADLSLRGFLMQEVIMNLQANAGSESIA